MAAGDDVTRGHSQDRVTGEGQVMSTGIRVRGPGPGLGAAATARPVLEKVRALAADAAAEAPARGVPRGVRLGLSQGARLRRAGRHARTPRAARTSGATSKAPSTCRGRRPRPWAAAPREPDHLVIGVIERDGGTLYCTVLFFAPDGALIGKHRKLMPTAMERLIWGFGDGSTLPVFDTPLGRIGAVICWENYMPLLRMAMYAKGVQLYCAPTADDREPGCHDAARRARRPLLRPVRLPVHHARRLPADYPAIQGDDPRRC